MKPTLLAIALLSSACDDGAAGQEGPVETQGGKLDDVVSDDEAPVVASADACLEQAVECLFDSSSVAETGKELEACLAKQPGCASACEDPRYEAMCDSLSARAIEYADDKPMCRTTVARCMRECVARPTFFGWTAGDFLDAELIDEIDDEITPALQCWTGDGGGFDNCDTFTKSLVVCGQTEFDFRVNCSGFTEAILGPFHQFLGDIGNHIDRCCVNDEGDFDDRMSSFQCSAF